MSHSTGKHDVHGDHLSLEVQEDGFELVWEQAMLDEGERERVLRNCNLVVHAGAVPWLVQLCASADGPIEDRTDPAYVPPAPGKKKGKGKSKKKKKAKLEPGKQLYFPVWVSARLHMDMFS